METTTQILFNSPALHSLKREQLVKLCKTHNLKANGKNVDMVERLKSHAQTLPPDAPLSVAVRSETEGDTSLESDEGDGTLRAPDQGARFVRPSEQWEMVMEDIEEESESQGTNSSRGAGQPGGEFGTGSSNGSNMTNSLKALASSFGLKKSQSVALLKSQKSLVFPDPKPIVADTLSQHSVPYNSVPAGAPIQTDHFVFSSPGYDTLVPGVGSRQGVPAPDSKAARLSMTAKEDTTTIRLITTNARPPQDGAPSTPILRAYEPTFQLIMGTPSDRPTVWPLSPEKEAATPTPLNFMSDTESTLTRDVEMAMTTPTKSAAPPRTKTPAPFIFGSPQPGVSNKAFTDIAAGMMQEMQRRVAEARQDGTADILREEGARILGRTNANAGAGLSAAANASPDRYAKVHDAAFDKMASINEHYAARKVEVTFGGLADAPSKKRKMAAMDGDEDGPRLPSGVGAEGARRVPSAAAVRRMAERGTSAQEADEGGRQAKRTRVAEDEVEAEGDAKDEDIEMREDAEKTHAEKEREAIRRKLEMNKARRRSSMGRPSMGKATKNTKASTSKGFFSSARNMVKNVFGGPPSKPAQPAAAVNKIKKPALPVTKKPSLTPASIVPAAAKPAGTATTRTASGSSAATRKVSGSTLGVPGSQASRSTSTSRARSPIPSFSHSVRSSTSGQLVGTGTASSHASAGSAVRKASGSTASSVGTRGSLAGTGTKLPTKNANGTVSSMGTRRIVSGGSSAAGTVGSQGAGTGTRRRTTSTLHAPTASSLAKSQTVAALKPASKTGTTTLTAVPELAGASQPLGQITNTPKESTADLSPEGGEDGIVKKKSTASTAFTAAASAKPAFPLRKPRISRSRVIAKLGAQRVASASGTSSGVPATPTASRKRSSLSTGARRSFGGVKAPRGVGGSSSEQVLMSARKKARRSEVINRRKSKIAAISAGAATDAEASVGLAAAMEVEA